MTTVAQIRGERKGAL
uniref:Uncharacterized protein n=1 Tax=Arundo donax TaxID=35708 RepID=A0A0A9BVQ7_ARUDO